MKAVQITAHGGPEVIEYGDTPEPEVGSEDVRVDVKAAALNHLDVWTRRGLPGIDLDLPHTPGSDAAGVVREVGADVTRFEPGDHVAVTAGVSKPQFRQTMRPSVVAPSTIPVGTARRIKGFSRPAVATRATARRP